MNTMFFTVALIGLLAVISPGPDFLIVTRNSLLYSKRVGLATALGIATGTLWWIASSILGISYVISKTVLLFNALKWFGALYLIYLGVQSFRTKKKTASPQRVTSYKKELSPAGAFRIGLLTNVLNPKCALFFVSLFSIIITPETPVILQCIYGMEIAVIALVWFSLLATVLSVERVKGSFERFSTILERTTGAILIALGIKVAFYRQK